jgi:type VI secretion system ImpA family protein
MAEIDVAGLLEPVSDDAPTGADFDGTNERYAIEAPFQVDGDNEGFDWRGTIRAILDQSKQTKDLWLATYLARAGASAGDLDTVVGGAELLAGYLETYWADVYPKLEDVDFIGRKTPCESLTKIREFIGPLKRTILISHPRLGNYSGADIERFATEGESASGYGMFRAALAETPQETIRESVTKLEALQAAIKRADAVLVANAGDDTGTNFQPTYDTIEAIRKSVLPYAGIDETPAEEEAMGEGGGTTGGAAGPRIAGRVDTREDVLKAMDAIMDYYRNKEPTSPVPTLLKRAREWVTLDFLQLVGDIMPDSLTEARRILVSKAERDAEGGYSY